MAWHLRKNLKQNFSKLPQDCTSRCRTKSCRLAARPRPHAPVRHSSDPVSTHGASPYPGNAGRTQGGIAATERKYCRISTVPGQGQQARGMAGARGWEEQAGWEQNPSLGELESSRAEGSAGGTAMRVLGATECPRTQALAVHFSFHMF